MVVRLDDREFFTGFRGPGDETVFRMDVGLLDVPGLDLGHELGVIPGLFFLLVLWDCWKKNMMTRR